MSRGVLLATPQIKRRSSKGSAEKSAKGLSLVAIMSLNQLATVTIADKALSF